MSLFTKDQLLAMDEEELLEIANSLNAPISKNANKEDIVYEVLDAKDIKL